jgi:hypothetical protein
LRDGDPVASEEALRLLETKGPQSGYRQWHVLEGETKVDCAIFADNLTVFVEGKRTERRLTKSVSWLRERDQVIRNLDCLRVEPNRAANWFVLLVVDANTTAATDARRLDLGGALVEQSLPHLTADEVTDAWMHYAGFTTWQSINREFAEVFGGRGL